MHLRFVAIAVAAFSLSAPAAAEPAKSAQAPRRPIASAPLMLASADRVATPVKTQPETGPAKHARVARATSCRCGEVQPQAEAQEQE